MMIVIGYFTLSILLTPLSGCSVDSYVAPEKVLNPDNALVFIYRPKASNPGSQPLRHRYPEVQVDDVAIGMLKHKGMLKSEVAAGTHTLRITGLVAEAKWQQRDIIKTFSALPGERKFFRLNVSYNMDEMVLLHPGAKYRISLVSVKEENAVYEIRDVQPAN